MMADKSIMWKYIAEEPEVLGRLLATAEIDNVAQVLDKKLKAVYFVAHGSSLNAAVTVSQFMAKCAGVRVYTSTPGNFVASSSSLALEDVESTLVVTISQTGTSSGVLDALQRARELGFVTLGLTDVAGSPLAKKACWVLPLLCGEENSNAKTKGYSATLMVLMLLSVALGRARGVLSEGQAELIFSELKETTACLSEVAAKVRAWCEETHFGEGIKEIYFLGSDMNFGTAMEGQLKLMETMCIPTMFNDMSEFSHGMHRAINKESSVVLFKTAGCFASLTEKTFLYLKEIAGQVVMFDATGGGKDDHSRIVLPHFPLTQSVLLTTLAVQILSVYGPESQGQDPNRDAHNDFTTVVGTRVG